MDNIYISLLDRLKKCQYAIIKTHDYDDLITKFYKDYAEKAIPAEYFDLREWVYKRVAKDTVYQNTGYLTDHFCIGTIFGMLKAFDKFNNMEVFNEDTVKEWAK